jgi:preprotein translocase subunit SecA
MDHLKEGIGLRGYGQKDPLVEYKKESFKLFQDMMDRIEDETVRYLYFLRFEQTAPALPFSMDDSEYEEEDDEASEEQKRIEQSKAAEEEQRRSAQSAVQDMTRNIQRQHEKELKELQFLGTNGGGTASKTVANGGPKVGRNDPCPCGSGKKYKKCHGVNS